MILESMQERIAFKFVCDLADAETSNRGCNDLDDKHVELFKGLTVASEEIDAKSVKIIQRPITMDFDILFWLKKQVKPLRTILTEKEEDEAKALYLHLINHDEVVNAPINPGEPMCKICRMTAKQILEEEGRVKNG